jgi:hypothetical protein
MKAEAANLKLVRISFLTFFAALILPFTAGWQAFAGSIPASEPAWVRYVHYLSPSPTASALQPQTDYGRKIVAAVLVAEAATEGEGMIAVAEVIHNRTVTLGLSPLQVVTQKFQFSCLNGKSTDALLIKMRSHPKFPIALELATLVYFAPEKLPGLAHGATHYHATWIKTPYWAQQKKPVARIGQHIFYRF